MKNPIIFILKFQALRKNFMKRLLFRTKMKNKHPYPSTRTWLWFVLVQSNIKHKL